MADKYSTIQQHQPLRVPSSFDKQGRALIVQLDEIFDDIYRRFGRLRIEDMGKTFRKRIEDDEGNISQIIQEIGQIVIEVADKYSKVSGITIESAGITISGSKYIDIKSGCTLDIESGGAANIKSGAALDIASGGNLNVKSGGDLNIQGGADLNIQNLGKINVQSGGGLDILSGGAIDIKGGASLDVAALGKINIESGGNLDVKGGGTIDIESTAALNIKSGGAMSVKSGGAMDVESGGNLNIKSGGNLGIKSGGNLDVESGGNLNVKSGADINIKSGADLNVESGGNLKVASGGAIDMHASGTLELTGSTVSIKSGSTFDVQSTNFEISSTNKQMVCGSWTFNDVGAKFVDPNQNAPFQIASTADRQSGNAGVFFDTTGYGHESVMLVASDGSQYDSFLVFESNAAENADIYATKFGYKCDLGKSGIPFGHVYSEYLHGHQISTPLLSDTPILAQSWKDLDYLVDQGDYWILYSNGGSGGYSHQPAGSSLDTAYSLLKVHRMFGTNSTGNDYILQEFYYDTGSTIRIYKRYGSCHHGTTNTSTYGTTSFGSWHYMNLT